MGLPVICIDARHAKDYIGPCIPNGPIRHKHAVGVSVRKELQCRDSGFVQSNSWNHNQLR
jgi:hypothetical protein